MASVVILALMAGSLILLAHGKSHVRLDAGTMPLSEVQKHRLILQSPGAPRLAARRTAKPTVRAFA